MSLPHSVALANNKGGVGKTSLTVNIAGIAAADGYRVLAVDLDQQANLARDLGATQADATDGGRGLTRLILDGDQVEPIHARPNLDLFAGGPFLNDVETLLAAPGRHRGEPEQALLSALSPIADDYDLILFDCPPRAGGRTVEIALVAARWLVIPTQADDGSIDGLQLVAEEFNRVRQNHGSDVELLGVVLFDVGASHKAIYEGAVDEITERFGHAGAVLSPAIRSARKVAVDTRKWGVTVHEYLNLAAAAPPWYEALREGNQPESYFARNATDVAGDYRAIADQVIAKAARK